MLHVIISKLIGFTEVQNIIQNDGNYFSSPSYHNRCIFFIHNIQVPISGATNLFFILGPFIKRAVACYDLNNVKGNVVTSKPTLPSMLHTASIYNVPGALHYSLHLTWTQLQGPWNNFTELVWLLSR